MGFLNLLAEGQRHVLNAGVKVEPNLTNGIYTMSDLLSTMNES